MTNQMKQTNVSKDSVIIGVHLEPTTMGSMKVQLVPVKNVSSVWGALGYLMEAVGVTAASMSKNGNPKEIDNYEEMADYVSEYITKVIMSARAK